MCHIIQSQSGLGRSKICLACVDSSLPMQQLWKPGARWPAVNQGICESPAWHWVSPLLQGWDQRKQCSSCIQAAERSYAQDKRLGRHMGTKMEFLKMACKQTGNTSETLWFRFQFIIIRAGHCCWAVANIIAYVLIAPVASLAYLEPAAIPCAPMHMLLCPYLFTLKSDALILPQAIAWLFPKLRLRTV